MLVRSLAMPILGTLALTTMPVLGQSTNQHVDISLYQDAGRVATGFYDFDTQSFVLDQRVFTEPLEVIQTSYHGVGAPGFYSDGANPLPSGALVDFDVPAIDHPFFSSFANASYTVDTHNLLYWDGVDDDNDGNRLDDVAFSLVPAGTTIQIRKSTFVNATVDGSTAPVPGFTLGGVNGAGGIHEHVGFRVQGPGGATPDDGLYLLPMTIGVTGLEDSETIYLLFNGDYDRDTNGNLQFNGILPLTDTVSEAAAQQWVDAYLLRDLGDFNDSDDLDANDIDQLFAQRGLADPAFGFDLTGDALITDDDLDRWVYELAGTRYGDANLDQNVNIVDLGILATGFGGAGGWGDGDFDGNGLVNIVDLGILATEFGFSAAATAELIAAFDDGGFDAAQSVYQSNVPEPATAGLVAIGVAAMAGRRRRA